jgi:uncharacterized protein (TIGR00730 family)
MTIVKATAACRRNIPRMEPEAPAPRIPEPPPVYARREPLPSQQPKPSEDDPGAPERVRAILASPSYREADQDIAFLDRSEARGPRLQLDYLKAELLLELNAIRHTIVVFGSTRIPEPAAAQRCVDDLRRALGRQGSGIERGRLAIAERVLAKSRYYEVAREFGRLMSVAGSASTREPIAIMTGGGPGLMEAANRGAYDAGAQSIGLNIALPHEQYPNPYVTPELCFTFHYFAVRKLHFLLRAKALVAFPGGYGTFDELFETLALVQTRKIKPIPVVLVGEAFWRRAFDVEFLVAEGVIDAEDKELFWFAETAQEIWDSIVRWHAAAGEPLLGA